MAPRGRPPGEGRTPTFTKKPTLVGGNLRIGNITHVKCKLPRGIPFSHAFEGIMYGRTGDGEVVVIHQGQQYLANLRHIPNAVKPFLFPETMLRILTPQAVVPRATLHTTTSPGATQSSEKSRSRTPKKST